MSTDAVGIDDATVAAAVAAVEAASRLTSAAQGTLIGGGTLTKTDDSPVTVADFGAQAVACAVLAERLGDVAIVGEEHPDDLATERPEFGGAVADLVGAALDRTVSIGELTDWLGLGTASATGDRYWTLDPIDGTKGFLRGDQYAIALGLIERGRVVLGVLGCPNYPVEDGRGIVLVAANGTTTEIVASETRTLRTVDPESAHSARFCESVESAHSDQGQSVEIADRLGITSEPYRIDSQCKYAAIARGDADIYLRLPTRADYREKIWDHAAGLAAVELAGGRVTDVMGEPLDFTHGARLESNRGVVASSGGHHDEIVAVVRSVLGE